MLLLNAIRGTNKNKRVFCASSHSSFAIFDYRRVELERKLATDASMSDERKQRQLQQLGKRESAFLRLRRTKLGLDDFRTVKVIGKGAFGEVRYAIEARFGIYTSSTYMAI